MFSPIIFSIIEMASIYQDLIHILFAIIIDLVDPKILI